MTPVFIVLIIWGACTAAFLALLAYNATLTRYEDDQLFLSDNNSKEHEMQDNIVKSVNRMKPFLRVTAGASFLLGVTIIGMYTYEAWQKLNH